jgi:hypothetical protein
MDSMYIQSYRHMSSPNLLGFTLSLQIAYLEC